MTWLDKLMRPDLRDMAAYSSARGEAGGFKPSLPLDANESPWPPFGSLAARCMANRYPEPQPFELKGRLAAHWKVAPETMLLGRGSDELIDLLIRLFCRAGLDDILICPPTFGVYEVYAAIQGAGVIRVPLLADDGWQIDVSAVIAACQETTKLIFIPSPNAPMGHLMRREDVLALCKAREEKSLVVVDEAYVEFTDQPEGMLGYLGDVTNLVLLRTLSKAQGLAGERVGAVLGDVALMRALQKIQAPYPLTQSSIFVAMEALSPNGLLEAAERRKTLIAERERVAALLPSSPFVLRVFPSVANFLLAETQNADSLMERLKGFGILARNRDLLVRNTVRFSLGTPEENDILLRALSLKVPVTPLRGGRIASVQRVTKETAIDVTVDLDGPSFLTINTGIGFFDHMLEQVATHGGFALALTCRGDLQVDQHHTIEDCALALGEAMKKALGDKAGLARFGFTAPLDEALAQITVDLSGRPFAVFDGVFPSEKAGEMDCAMAPHFFLSLATALGAAIHVTVKGENAHHMIEACFKALGRALRQALRCEGAALPSTKGVL